MLDQPKEQLQILNKFARDLMRLSSVHDLIWYVVEEVVGQQGFVDCVIYLHDQKRNKLVQAAAYGDKKGPDHSVTEKIELEMGQGITGYVAQSKKPERITDTAEDHRYIEDLRNMRSELTVPILYGDHLYGVIDCEHHEVGYFTQDHEDLLTTIASMLAVRIAEWKTHEQLAESEEKYRQLFEQSEDAMMLLTQNKFELCNKGAANMFDYQSPEEMQRAHPSEVSPEYQPCGMTSFDKAEKMMRIALDTGYHRFEWMHQKKGGEVFPVEVTLTRVPYEGQIALYAICRDITEAKENQAALKKALMEAEAANRAKSSFLANMSHELRTPLNAVIGMSEIMKNHVFGPLGSPKYDEYASDIYRSGTFLLQLINDILDLSAIDAKERTVQKSHLDVAEIISDCTVMVSSLADKKKIEIHTELDKAPDTVWADSRALRQILINLISNAVKFGYEGGDVWLCASETKDAVSFTVRDNGRGIPEDRLDTITHRFDRGHLSPTDAIEGTGLGLAIVKQFVELHGGTLTVESVLNEGTMVTLSLPKQEP